MKAIGIMSHTLVGAYGEPPLEFGNCCSVKADDGHEYNIVNFVYENIEALVKLGLTWPVDIEVIGPRTAVLNDHRIAERWYKHRFCEACTPRDLLPLPQRLVHKREIARGRRVEGATFTSFDMRPSLGLIGE